MKQAEVEWILDMMKSAKEEHPNATVLFDPEHSRVNITYPLPVDLKDHRSGDIGVL